MYLGLIRTLIIYAVCCVQNNFPDFCQERTVQELSFELSNISVLLTETRIDAILT